MNPPPKPREWLIKLQHSPYCTQVHTLIDKSMAENCEFYNDAVHVIEYSAYTALLEKCESLSAELAEKDKRIEKLENGLKTARDQMQFWHNELINYRVDLQFHANRLLDPGVIRIDEALK